MPLLPAPRPQDCPAVTSKAYSLFTHLEVAPNRGFSRSPANKAGPGIVWSYFDGGATDLPAASGDDASWAGAKFADADKWAKGAAPLGRGEGVAWATTIPAGAAPGGTTYLYFRTTLCLTQGILDQVSAWGSRSRAARVARVEADRNRTRARAAACRLPLPPAPPTPSRRRPTPSPPPPPPLHPYPQLLLNSPASPTSPTKPPPPNPAAVDRPDAAHPVRRRRARLHQHGQRV
jgi:hypothetical protein